MNRLMKTVTAFIVALAMIAVPLAEAQSRGRQSHTSGTPSSSQNVNRRPGNGNTNNGNRPGGNNRPGSGIGSNNRPGGNRPGHGSDNSNRPGNNHSRPGNGGNRPGNNHDRPGHGARPPRPDHGHHGGHYRPGHTVGPNHYRPPRIPHGYRHPVPFFGVYHRPVPPPSWHRYYAGPTFGTILGVALGTTLDLSINALINSGYTVTNYGSNVVYLSNVPQMNLLWPNAAMYYNNGMLCGSQFTYPSPYYDMQRYNLLYNQFTGQYGVPVEQYNRGGVISSTWFGAGNRFVTLEFCNVGGQYYTTLSFGN